MNLNVVNYGMSVGFIEVGGLAASSVLLIGDCERIGASSIFDTPPESLVVGTGNNLIPLAPR